MVIPSTPGLPLLLRTRFHALSRFPRSHTSSISCSAKAGLSGAGFVINGPARMTRWSMRQNEVAKDRCSELLRSVWAGPRIAIQTGIGVSLSGPESSLARCDDLQFAEVAQALGTPRQGPTPCGL